MKTLLIVANPRSGRGRSLRVAEEFARIAKDSGFDCILISDFGIERMKASIQQVLKSGDPKIDGLVSIGGDGLLHTLLPLIAEHQLPFTVIPTGTGNDFAREIGTTRKSHQEILKTLSSLPCKIDSVVISSQNSQDRACQVLSLGFDALVNERANRFSRVRGKLKYVVATIAELPLFKPLDFNITIDGVDYSKKAMLIAIANGPSYGGGMKICPEAKFDDGLLDVLILSKVSILELIRVFPKVYSGSHVRHPAVEIIRGREITVDAPAKAFADGEFIAELPISVRVEPASLQVWR
jgi:diacylglycerol kinase (ATP)